MDLKAIKQDGKSKGGDLMSKFVRYIDIEPVLNFIPIKLDRVFLSYNQCTLSSAAPNILPIILRKTAIESFYVSCRSLFGRQGNLLP